MCAPTAAESDRYRILQRHYVWQRFADNEMEAKFREVYWVKNMRHALNVILALTVLVVSLVVGECIFENSFLTDGHWGRGGACEYPQSKVSRPFLLALCSFALVPNVILRQTWPQWLQFWAAANSVFATIVAVMCICFVMNHVFPLSPSCQCVRGKDSISDLEECPTGPEIRDKACYPQGFLAWELRRSEIDCSLFGATANQMQIIFLLFLPRLLPIFKCAHLSWLYFGPWLVVAIGLPFFFGSHDQDSVSMYVQKAIFSFIWLFMANSIAINHKFMLEKSQRSQFSSERQDHAVLLLLFNILKFMLPPHILKRQVATPNLIIADHVDFCSILFCCIDDFDVHVKRFSPSELLEFLNGCFTSFDELCNEFSVSKIETIGEVYVCAVGLSPDDLALQAKVGHSANLERLLHVGQEMLNLQNKDVTFKIGLHTGPIVAGVVGTKLPRYRLFGDTINMAARMEQKGFPGEVNFSLETLKFLPASFAYEWRATVEMKGKGKVDVNVLKRAEATERQEQAPRASVLHSGLVEHLVEGNRSSVNSKKRQHGTTTTTGSGPLLSSDIIARMPGSQSNHSQGPQCTPSERASVTPSSYFAGASGDIESQICLSDKFCDDTLAEPLLDNDMNAMTTDTLDWTEDPAFDDVITEVDRSEPNMQYKYRQRSCIPAPKYWTKIGKRMKFRDSIREKEFLRWYHEKFVVRKIEKRLRMHIVGIVVLTSMECTWNLHFPITSPHQLWGEHRMVAFLLFRGLCVMLAGVWWYLSSKPWISQHPLYVQRWLTLTLCVMAVILFLSTDALHPYFPGVHFQQKFEPGLDDGDLPYESVRTASYFLQYMVVTSQYRLLFRQSLIFVPLAFVLMIFSTSQCFCVYIYFVSKAAFLCGTILSAFVAHSLEHMSRKRFARDRSRRLTRMRIEKTLETLMPPRVVDELRTLRATGTPRERTRSIVTRRSTVGSASGMEAMASVPVKRNLRRLSTRCIGLPSISHEYAAVTILQADVVGFTKLASLKSPQEVLKIVGDLFAIFDDLTDEHGVYKLETVGDAYIAVQGGPPLTETTDSMALIHLAMAMVNAISRWTSLKSVRADEALASIDLRVGVHHGPVVGGIVGQDMQRYHLFGKTMHVMDLLEATSLPGKVHVSQACRKALEPSEGKHLYVFQPRLIQQLKTSKGDVVSFDEVGGKTYFLSKRGEETEWSGRSGFPRPSVGATVAI